MTSPPPSLRCGAATAETTSPAGRAPATTRERTSNPAERNALYGRAEALLLEESPVAPVYHYTHVFLVQPSVHGWNPTLLDHHPYKDVWLGD
jgi:ABC-type oligopeptide transport system substrate-binding subunit